MSLLISENAKGLMLKDAERSYPFECCGFLLGNIDGKKRNITNIIVVNNAHENNKERKFEINERDYMKAERYADENNLSLLGIYHSHPDHPAVPSEYDLKSALPFFSYVIISVVKGKTSTILSWQLNEKNKFQEETIN